VSLDWSTVIDSRAFDRSRRFSAAAKRLRRATPVSYTTDIMDAERRISSSLKRTFSF
jgi:hypothetical protein